MGCSTVIRNLPEGTIPDKVKCQDCMNGIWKTKEIFVRNSDNPIGEFVKFQECFCKTFLRVEYTNEITIPITVDCDSYSENI